MADPETDRRDVNEAEEAFRRLVVAGRDTPGVALPLNLAHGALGGSGQNMGVMRGVFCLRRSADHRELRPL